MVVYSYYEYYSMIQGNELSSHGKMWRKPKWILLSKWSQFGNAIYYKIPAIWHFVRGKTIETVKKKNPCNGFGGMKRSNK